MDQTLNDRILIVGENSHFLYLLQRFVKISAHQMIAANLGDDVLALTKCKKPAAIVLEVDMPETFILRSLKALKADPETNAIPVIVCSWLNEEERCLAQEADIYLRMPIQYEDFENALATIQMRKT